MIFDNKNILITGGTGSLGKTLIKNILSGQYGTPNRIIVFSRDEAKQFFMQSEYKIHKDIEIRDKFKKIVKFVIGDVRNYNSVSQVCKQSDIIINTAALKQVPSCELFPYEAIQTNINGANNIITSVIENNLKCEVIGVSTDKACKPVNVMGMTKSLQEKLFLEANLRTDNANFNCVRYGNVLSSRGSVIPYFIDLLNSGKKLTITTEKMTRFLISLDDATSVIFNTLHFNGRGKTFIPNIKSAKVIDIAKVICDIFNVKFEYDVVGIRSGEKEHEILISEEEVYRTFRTEKLLNNKDYYVINSVFDDSNFYVIKNEYSSNDYLMDFNEIKEMLLSNNLAKTIVVNKELLM